MINLNDIIPAQDLAQSAPGSSDSLIGLQGSGLRRFPAASLPVPTAVNDRLIAVEAGQGAGVFGYATKAAMDADLVPANGAVAKVTNDTTAANNGEYRKNGASGAGSWVKSAYDPKTDVISLGALSRNSGAVFPFSIKNRAGVTSASSPLLVNAILSAKVINARAGKVYGIRYYMNGYTGGSGHVDGWIIDEANVSTYPTTGAATSVVYYTDPAPAIVRDGSIQTIRIQSPTISGLAFEITVDSSKLQAYGSPYNLSAAGSPGYSWILDPVNYLMRDASVYHVGDKVGVMSYSITASGDVTVTYQNGTRNYRLVFGRFGPNQLPNFKGFYYAPADGSAGYLGGAINTDFLPPLQVAAVSGGDGSPPGYTGGNHEWPNAGDVCAKCDYYQLLVDGQPVPMADVSGGADCITAVFVNELQGYNTSTGTKRYVIRQTMMVDIRPGGAEVRCEVSPLEPVTVGIDNGLQVGPSGWFSSTQLMLGGQYGRVAYDSSKSSGPISTYPDAWALILTGIAGQLVTWMDRAYGAGDGQYLLPSADFIRGGSPNTKFYHMVIGGNPVSLNPGQSYRWRGGYLWQDAPVPPGLDSRFTFWKAGTLSACLARSESDYTTLP